MIAATNPSSRSRQWQHVFLAMLPTIRRHAAIAFRNLRPEAREEAVQDVVANTLSAVARLAELGKLELAYATVLAKFGVAQVRSGRRLGGHLNINDVMSPYAQRRKGFRVHQFDEHPDTDGPWQEALVEARRFGPAELAAARIDVADWLARLSKFKRRVAKTLGSGETTGATARRHGVSAGRVSQLRREFERSWRLFQGELCAA